MLFTVGGLFALYEAYHKAIEVHEGKPNELLEGRWWWVAMVVLLGRDRDGGPLLPDRDPGESSKTRGSASWVEFIRRAKSPELPVILLEDFAALIGLVLALLGVGLSKLDRQRLLRRRRYGGHRAAAGGGGDRARHRDQEPAAR